MQITDDEFELMAGTQRMVIRIPEAASFNGQPIRWQLGTGNPERGSEGEMVVYLDGIAYEGPVRSFDFSEPVPCNWSVQLELN